MKTVFISGTGTEVGKTYVTAALAHALIQTGRKVGVYKPVASGCIAATEFREDERQEFGQSLVSTDALILWEAIDRRCELDAVCPQRFRPALAPNEAARQEGRSVDESEIFAGIDRWRSHCDILLVEGAGGLFSPLSDTLLNIDLFEKLQTAELLLVAPNRLGVIHDTIATCTAARHRGVSVRNLVLSAPPASHDASSSSNAEQLQQWCAEIVIHTIAAGDPIQLSSLRLFESRR